MKTIWLVLLCLTVVIGVTILCAGKRANLVWSNIPPMFGMEVPVYLIFAVTRSRVNFALRCDNSFLQKVLISPDTTRLSQWGAAQAVQSRQSSMRATATLISLKC